MKSVRSRLNFDEFLTPSEAIVAPLELHRNLELSKSTTELAQCLPEATFAAWVNFAKCFCCDPRLASMKQSFKAKP